MISSGIGITPIGALFDADTAIIITNEKLSGIVKLTADLRGRSNQTADLDARVHNNFNATAKVKI
jgi:hypothetical protein